MQTPTSDESDNVPETVLTDSEIIAEDDSLWQPSDISGGEDFVYPSDWHLVDVEEDMELRSLSVDMYEIRSPSFTLKLNREGFDLWRDNSPQGQVIFADWMARNNVQANDREPIEPEVNDGNES